MKRLFDLFISVPSLVFLSPILLIVGLVNFFVFRGRVFFFQDRVGYKSKIFKIIKFTTMSDDISLSEMERVNAWGRLLRSSSIDELPELINIILGQMSLVGPRPLLKDYLSFYTEEERRRHDVIPGLSGLAQINGRNTLSWSEKFTYDLEYVEKQSFFLDMKIIIKTILYVFKRMDINKNETMQMERFDNPLYLIGAGGHSSSVLFSMQGTQLDVRGVYDDTYEDKYFHERKYMGPIDNCKNGRGIIAIGDNRTRFKISEKLKLKWETLVSPSAVVHSSAIIGEGSVILANCHIGPNVVIGKHSIINTGANIEHGSKIGNFSHIAPGVNLCGNVSVGDFSFVGASSVVIPGIVITKNVYIGAGSVVVKNIQREGKYIGHPAKEKSMKDKNEEKLSKNQISVSMAKPLIDESDIAGVLEVLKSGHLSLGPKIVEFEDRFCKYIGIKHAVGISSGTAGLHLIMLAMGIGKGDEILVPSYTFVASVSTIMHTGATPVFVDIEDETYCMDPSDIRNKITPRTKAILGVDIFGHPANWPEIVSIAEEYKLYTIDDSCEAIGAKINGQMVGTFADASTFAFYPNKQMTTGEGGMVVTDCDDLADKIRALRNQGRNSMGGWLKHEYLGYNYRMNEMSASLGITQLAKIDKLIDMRSDVAKMYNAQLDTEAGYKVQKIGKNMTMSWFVYVVTLDREFSRDEIITKLEENNVPARAYFDPIHEQPFIEHSLGTDFDLPVTVDIGNRTLALPFHPLMTKDEVEFVCVVFKKVMQEMMNQSKSIVERVREVAA